VKVLSILSAVLFLASATATLIATPTGAFAQAKPAKETVPQKNAEAPAASGSKKSRSGGNSGEAVTPI
jgi:hypothetical protein